VAGAAVARRGTRGRDVCWLAMISCAGARGDVLLEPDRDLMRIGEGLQRARQGHAGALVVEGPAGIGKTLRLMQVRHEPRGRLL
jgi:hypothetical protein